MEKIDTDVSEKLNTCRQKPCWQAELIAYEASQSPNGSVVRNFLLHDWHEENRLIDFRIWKTKKKPNALFLYSEGILTLDADTFSPRETSVTTRTKQL